MKEARFYEKKEKGIVQCLLCPHRCVLKEGKTGLCRSRKNINGKLYSLIYQVISSLNMDPVEKKPLYHFYPGSHILSAGTYGCNFSCRFCQNWTISQAQVADIKGAKILKSEELVGLALKYKSKGNIGLAYTYNEPFIWYEYIYETAKLAGEKGLKNVLVTNGFVNEEPLKELLPLIDALNIDVKGMKEEFYKGWCRGKLEPVLKTCEIASKKALVEITNLIIPSLNDSIQDIQKLVGWIYEKLGKDTPLHFSRYSPEYQCDIPPTPVETLERAFDIASKKLNYVYVGNVLATQWEHTFCPNCKIKLIDRSAFSASILNLKGNHCAKCNEKIHIINSN